MGLLIVLLGLLQDPEGADWTEAQKAARSALKSGDPAVRGEAAARLGRHDRKESVDLLLDLWAASVFLSRPLEQEKRELLAKRDALAVKEKLQGGNVQLSGADAVQYRDYVALSEKIKIAEERLQGEERCREKLRQALQGLASAQAVSELAKRLGPGERDWAVRAAAAEALGTAGDAEALEALCKAAPKEKDPRVLLSIVESLGTRRQPAALPVIAELMKKESAWPLLSACVAALKALGDPRGVEPLIGLLSTATGRLRDEVNTALLAMTGVDKKGDPATWKDWFQRNRESLLAGGYQRPGDDGRRDGGPQGTTFYGIPVVSKRVIFILDRSGSMSEPALWKPDASVATGPGRPARPAEKIGDRKIDVARYELKWAILGLQEDVRFNVIFFNHEYTTWLAEGLESATAANKAKAVEFIEKLQPDGATNIFDPLEKGFLVADTKAPPVKSRETVTSGFNDGADTIYLMSDGAPNKGRITEPTAILDKVRELNRQRKVVIHSIGVGAAINETFMRALGEQNGGTFVWRK